MSLAWMHDACCDVAAQWSLSDDILQNLELPRKIKEMR